MGILFNKFMIVSSGMSSYLPTSIPEFSLFAIVKVTDAPGIPLVNADVPRDQILQDFWSICHVIIVSHVVMITSQASIDQGYPWSVRHLENSEQGDHWDRGCLFTPVGVIESSKKLMDPQLF